MLQAVTQRDRIVQMMSRPLVLNGHLSLILWELTLMLQGVALWDIQHQIKKWQAICSICFHSSIMFMPEKFVNHKQVNRCFCTWRSSCNTPEGIQEKYNYFIPTVKQTTMATTANTNMFTTTISTTTTTRSLISTTTIFMNATASSAFSENTALQTIVLIMVFPKVFLNNVCWII